MYAQLDNKKVTVVIPVYNGWNLLKRNIDSLISFDKEYISEIIVIDDCSPESNPYQFDNIVHITKNKENLGYTGTVNKGLKKANTDVILLLDSDAYLISPILSNIISSYDKDTNLGCVGYKTVDDKGQLTGSFCYEPTVLGFILGQQLESRMEHLSFIKRRNIMPYSCTVSFRKKCLEDVNYFHQDRFPILDADIDLSMRIHRSHWKLLFDKNIRLSHSGGNSYKVNYKRVLLFYKSRWMLFKVHELMKFPKLVKCLVICRLIIEYYLLALVALVKKRNNNITEKKMGRKIILKEFKTFEV
jgi:GT2 family glycosyltransferase